MSGLNDYERGCLSQLTCPRSQKIFHTPCTFVSGSKLEGSVNVETIEFDYLTSKELSNIGIWKKDLFAQESVKLFLGHHPEFAPQQHVPRKDVLEFRDCVRDSKVKQAAMFLEANVVQFLKGPYFELYGERSLTVSSLVRRKKRLGLSTSTPLSHRSSKYFWLEDVCRKDCVLNMFFDRFTTEEKFWKLFLSRDRDFIEIVLRNCSYDTFKRMAENISGGYGECTKRLKNVELGVHETEQIYSLLEEAIIDDNMPCFKFLLNVQCEGVVSKIDENKLLFNLVIDRNYDYAHEVAGKGIDMREELDTFGLLVDQLEGGEVAEEQRGKVYRLVELMLERGLDKNAFLTPEKDSTPLTRAVCARDVRLVQSLLEKGRGKLDLSKNVALNGPESTVHPSIIAVDCGNVEVLQLLIQNGLDIRGVEKGVNGDIPLIRAVEKGKVAVVRELLKSDADLTQKSINREYQNALHVASMKGHGESVEEILKNKRSRTLSLNKRDLEGNTPLHYAIQREHAGVAEKLLRSGARKDVVNCFGVTSGEDVPTVELEDLKLSPVEESELAEKPGTSRSGSGKYSELLQKLAIVEKNHTENVTTLQNEIRLLLNTIESMKHENVALSSRIDEESSMFRAEVGRLSDETVTSNLFQWIVPRELFQRKRFLYHIESPPVKYCGHEFVIRFYPKGCKSKKYASLYLMLKTGGFEQYTYTTSFALTLVNVQYPDRSLSYCATNVFKKNEYSWGFSDLVEKSQICADDAGFLNEDGELKIEVRFEYFQVNEVEKKGIFQKRLAEKECEELIMEEQQEKKDTQELKENQTGVAGEIESSEKEEEKLLDDQWMKM